MDLNGKEIVHGDLIYLSGIITLLNIKNRRDRSFKFRWFYGWACGVTPLPKTQIMVLMVLTSFHTFSTVWRPPLSAPPCWDLKVSQIYYPVLLLFVVAITTSHNSYYPTRKHINFGYHIMPHRLSLHGQFRFGWRCSISDSYWEWWGILQEEAISL